MMVPEAAVSAGVMCASFTDTPLVACEDSAGVPRKALPGDFLGLRARSLVS